MSRLSDLKINLIRRNARKAGPASSDLINDSLDEISLDLTHIQEQWNDFLTPLLAELPDEAFSDGLDGNTFYADAGTATTGIGARYYNGTHSRPNTLKEQLDLLYTQIDDTAEELQFAIRESHGQLTDAVKGRIGARIFNTSLASGTNSLDGRVVNLLANMEQLALDLYGTTGALDGDGLANLETNLLDRLEPAPTETDHSAAYSITSNDYVILADTTTGNAEITLTDAETTTGRTIVVKDVAGVNDVVVSTETSATIDGAVSVSFSSYGARTFFCDGTDWYIIASA